MHKRLGVVLSLSGMMATRGDLVGQEWKIKVSVVAGTEIAAATENLAAAGDITTLQISCEDPADCTKLRVSLKRTGVLDVTLSTSVQPTPRSWTFNAPLSQTIPEAGGADLVIEYSSNGAFRPIGTFKVTRAQTGAPDQPPGTLFELVTAPCRDKLNRANYDSLPSYQPKGDSAAILITPTGQLLAGDLSQFDEDDQLNVYIVSARAIEGRLKVYRRSPARAQGTLRILGAEEIIPKTTTQALREPTCYIRKYQLRDFAPGAGVAEVSVVLEDLSSKVVGSVEFGVHPLYHGAFTLAGVSSRLLNPIFALTPDSLITISEDGAGANYRMFVSVFYTPFIWGKRDLEKPRGLFELTALNPTIGLGLNDVSDNFLVGLSYDVVSSVYLHAGVHIGRVGALDPHAINPSTGKPYALGDKFNGAAEAISTVKNWDTDWYFSVGVDLRAGVALMRKVLGTGATP